MEIGKESSTVEVESRLVKPSFMDLKERICFLKDQLNKQSSVLVALKCNYGSYSPYLKLCVLSLIRHEVP